MKKLKNKITKEIKLNLKIKLKILKKKNWMKSKFKKAKRHTEKQNRKLKFIKMIDFLKKNFLYKYIL